MPVQELNESGEKGTVTGIIFSKRKGGMYIYKYYVCGWLIQYDFEYIII